MTEQKEHAAAARVREFREALGWSQESLADSSAVHRTEIVAIEAGRNKCSLHRMRQNLADGFGIRTESMSQYLDGKLSLAEVLEERVSRNKVRAIETIAADGRISYRDLTAIADSLKLPAETTELDWIIALLGEGVKRDAGRPKTGQSGTTVRRVLRADQLQILTHSRRGAAEAKK